MAGDLHLTEHAVILDGRGRAFEATRAEPMPFLHRYGERVLIGPTPALGRAGAQTVDLARSGIADSLVVGLSETERLGLEALRYRLQPDYIAAKHARPYEGQKWNMRGCIDAAQVSSTQAGRALEAQAAAPTSAYLEGSVAVGLIIVEGPTADLQFSADERTRVVAEVQNGLSWLATMNPFAGISFTYDIRVVTLNVQPDPNTADREALWRDPAMAALGFEASWNGVVQYVEDIRSRFATRWTYCSFFTKYPID
jgi:hypothetical protein